MSLLKLLGSVAWLCAFVSCSDLEDTITCVHQYIDQFQGKMNPKLFKIFKKAFPNTLETTIQHYNLTEGQEQTYIITGDIEAMWLRDSTNQFIPYIRMKNKCPNVQTLSKGLINMQASMIMVDGYANAFKRYEKVPKKRPPYINDTSQTLIFGISVDLCRHKQYATQAIWERKFEIDSLASFLRLCYEHYRSFESIDFVGLNFFKALRRILSVLQEQQKDELYEKENDLSFYTFYRYKNKKELLNGHIKPSRYTGMIKSGFRPSDDPNQLAFNIPGNAMASTYLRYVAEYILTKIPSDSVYYHTALSLRAKMLQFSTQIRQGIFKYGIVEMDGVDILAYEIDGMGGYRLMDDSNLPSLISLPYFDFLQTNSDLYRNTRAFLTSKKNPYFYSSGKINGIGSSHSPKNYIWPLELMTQILTSDNDEEIENLLDSLIASSVHDVMHESFSVLKPKKYTREWFAWANSFFGETIRTLLIQKPHILQSLSVK